MNEIVSDVGTAGNDVVQKETAGSSSDSQHISVSAMDGDEVNQTTGNTDKESVTVQGMEEESSPKDVEASQISPVKHGAEVKNDGTRQPEL